MTVGAVRIAFLQECQSTLAAFQPGRLNAFRQALQQAARSLEPAVGDSAFAAECPAIPRQPHRDTRRGGPVIRFKE
jgi:hypothetical protein